MLFDDTYLTIEAISESTFREKGSKFIGISLPVKTEPEVKSALDNIRKKYFDATHHCYAFRLGFDKLIFRCNDDGEPSGTAGRPILGQIQSKDLTDILVVVVRYYGGTKLGVSGLINAYKTAAKDALEANVLAEKTVKDVFQVHFDYLQMNDVMRVLKDENANILSQDFDNACQITFSVRKMQSMKLEEIFSKMKQIHIKYLKTI